MWCCVKKVVVKDLLGVMRKAKESDKIINEQHSDDELKSDEKVIMATNPSYPAYMHLNGNPISMVIANINSFAGGNSHPWSDAKGKKCVKIDPSY
jgi:hypothetical protein